MCEHERECECVYEYVVFCLVHTAVFAVLLCVLMLFFLVYYIILV